MPELEARTDENAEDAPPRNKTPQAARGCVPTRNPTTADTSIRGRTSYSSSGGGYAGNAGRGPALGGPASASARGPGSS
ncbi:hypothetical protein N7486_002455 [Penicillium sp. IBT 16267x]|nr:hypothetical protein N7486_002455 [Penicillium sp. IBT 16267x]